uniref:Glycerophosphodiester phosphodiesterase n=1 Tax=Peronospora matthiolae TaxID=2874970 RepID=A0AAV1VD75_9STRA
MADTSLPAATVEFVVRLLDEAAAADRVVCLLGSAAELGAWDVARAVPLELVGKQKSESTWRAFITFSAATNTLEYKYIIKHRQTLELVSWEGLPGNRTVTIAHGPNVALRAISSQSSTYTTSRAPVPGPRGAELGNNGSTNGFQEWRCCRTERETNPWWEVDLGKLVDISSVHVWNAMTYHEQAKHPRGRPPLTSKSSHAPPLWLFFSKEPLGRGADSFEDAQAKAAADPSSVHAIEMQNSFGSRARSLNFAARDSHRGDSVNGGDFHVEGAAELSPVEARYIRLQCAGVSCALQFAELQVFAHTAENDHDTPRHGDLCIKVDDGFHGVATAVEEDLREYIESGWLDPAADVAELKVWVGSFNKPAIQWFDAGPKHDRAVIDMRHEKRVMNGNRATHGPRSQTNLLVNGKSSGTWESLPVEVKSAALLDKESTELRKLFDEHQQKAGADISAYLNNDLSAAPPSAESADASWLSRLACVQMVETSDMKALSDKVATQKYVKGESILHYAEQKRAVFYVRSGDVELLGPKSSTGTILLGTLAKGSVFNEMGIFSVWSRQPVLFRAKDDVVCEVLDLETLLTVLGVSKVTSIRNGYARSRRKAALLSEDRTAHYTDATHAQVFCIKVPVDVVDGSKNHTDGLLHRWTLDVYDCQEDAQLGSFTRSKLLGSAFLLPSQIKKQEDSDLTVPIFSTNMDVIGQLTLAYLVLTPFAHPKNNIANVWRSYWRERPPLTIGHRGMGRSHYQVDGYRLALTRENTLASFILAGRSGADFVEFDVQLTKDKVPVIYHDFMVNVGLEDKSAGSFGTKSEMYEIGIHDMTFRQLTHAHTSPVPHKRSKSQTLQSRLKKHWARLQKEKQLLSPRHGPFTGHDTMATEEGHLVEFFPRLEDLLKHVPAEVGLNIEVKYPDSFFHAAMRSLSSFTINAYVDTILKCVFDHAGSRRIFFSCFDPSICVALRVKQTKYPVLFLTYGFMAPHTMDARMTLQFATNFAKMEELQGIVSNSDAIIETPELAPLVKKYLGTVLMTWGDQNTNHEMVQLQKRYAVDGVISDNVIDLINQDKKLQALDK